MSLRVSPLTSLSRLSVFPLETGKDAQKSKGKQYSFPGMVSLLLWLYALQVSVGTGVKLFVSEDVSPSQNVFSLSMVVEFVKERQVKEC